MDVDIDPNGDVVLWVAESPTKVSSGEDKSGESDTKVQESVGETGEADGDHGLAIQTITKQENAHEGMARFRVSSKHLRLASSYFDLMLSDHWPEGKSLAANETVELTLPDINPASLLIILNAIHGKFRNVPQSLSLQQLVDVSVAVDFSKCLEVMEIFARAWLHKIRSGLPQLKAPCYPELITIAWCFQLKDILLRFVKHVIQTWKGHFDTKGLRIPGHIVEFIDKTREKLLHEALRDIEQQAFQWLAFQPECELICQKEYVWQILRALLDCGIHLQLQPISRFTEDNAQDSTPFRGLSLDAIEKTFQVLPPSAECPRECRDRERGLQHVCYVKRNPLKLRVSIAESLRELQIPGILQKYLQ